MIVHARGLQIVLILTIICFSVHLLGTRADLLLMKVLGGYFTMSYVICILAKFRIVSQYFAAEVTMSFCPLAAVSSKFTGQTAPKKPKGKMQHSSNLLNCSLVVR